MSNTSVRFDAETLDRLDQLAKSLDRSRSWVINRAVRQYLEYEQWFARRVAEAMDQAGEGKLVAHDEMMAELDRRIPDPG